MWVSAASAHWFRAAAGGGGCAKKTQRYNPELPILQGAALDIFVKHVCHVVKLAPGDGDSCGREQLLAGAEMTGTVRGSLEQLVANLGGVEGRWGQPAVGSPRAQKEVWEAGGWQKAKALPPHMMVALSSSISSRSRRASSCAWLRSCCSLVMCSTVFCSVMAWLVCGRVGGCQSSATRPVARPAPGPLRRHRAPGTSPAWSCWRSDCSGCQSPS